MKNLYLVTNGYPYTAGEVPFIQPELELLINKYKVRIIACLAEGENDKDNEETKRLKNKGVLLYKHITRRKNAVGIIKGALKCVCPCFFREVTRVIKSKSRIPERLALVYVHYTETIDLYEYILNKGIIEYDTEGLFYSFWFHKAAHAGIMLKKKKYDHLKIISRIHGYDLYNDQGVAEFQPFKCQMDRGIDRLLFICEQGKQYYLEHFASSSNEDKYIVNRLGVYDPGLKRVITKRNDGLHLVSCSTICAVKRVNLIVEALSSIDDMTIYWTHFGDGPDFEELIKLSKSLLDNKDNIRYELKGRVTNHEVLEYYKESKPDCIINVSFSEGSPVSLQEAVSFGIPVIATDVGGSSEMIDGNGVLLSGDSDIEEIIGAIRRIAYQSDDEYAIMQRKSMEIWESLFDRKKNIIEFENILDGIC